MRVLHVALALVVVTCCLASSVSDYAEVADLSAADLGSAKHLPKKAGAAASFSKVPFFKLDASAALNIKAKTKSQCHADCAQHSACKSFSFSVRRAECLISKEAIAWNLGFTFYSRRLSSAPMQSGRDRTSKYRPFRGMMFLDKSFSKYHVHSKKMCSKYCDSAKNSRGQRCGGFSYRAGDQTCLLSVASVTTNRDFDYYERMPHSEVKRITVKKVSKTGKVKKFKVRKKIKATGGTHLRQVYKHSVKKTPWNKTPEMKGQLATQEAAAKAGKQRLKKQQLWEWKQHEAKVARLLKSKKMNKVKREHFLKKEKKVKSRMAKRHKEVKIKKKEKAKAREEHTSKKFLVMKQKVKAEKRKRANAAKKALQRTKAKFREKLKKELGYKTKKKELAKKARRHHLIRVHKVNVLIKAGIKLARTERKNKKKAYRFKEHNAKHKLVKMQVKQVKGNRHARHKKVFKKFVKKTLKFQLKKKKIDKAVAASMKKLMKQRKRNLTRILKKQKKKMAVAHMTLTNMQKLKAKANGLQHIINISAKKGKKEPATNVKLKYTLNRIAALRAKKAYTQRVLARIGRKVVKKRLKVLNLDKKMTSLKVGRRRRATTAPTKAKPNKKIVPKIKKSKAKNPLKSRRRRSKARLMKRMMKLASQSAPKKGGHKYIVPAVPHP